MALEDKAESVEQEIIEFAQRDPTITAVFKGVDPEEGSDTYHILRPGQKYDSSFEDRVTELDLRIAATSKIPYDFISWPISAEQAKDLPYMRECIYRKSA